MKVLLVVVILFASSWAAQVGFNIRKPWLPHIQNNKVVGRVTNGRNALLGEHPYQISYQWGIFGTFDHVCGGSIISPSYVLTAGHCITELPQWGDFRIVAGIINLNDNTPQRQNIPVVEKIVHPLYAADVGPYDIAIVKLAFPLVFNDVVQFIRLPPSSAVVAGQTELSGWGSISLTASPIYPDDLQTLSVPIVPNSECNAVLDGILTDPRNPNTFDFNSNICTGPLNGGYSACSGDSGGPLAQNGVLYGVVSWGFIPCGSVGAPSVYSKVANFVDFIRLNVPDLPNNN